MAANRRAASPPATMGLIGEEKELRERDESKEGKREKKR